MESFWPVSEITHFKNFVKITDCCAALNSKGLYGHFKIQCENYKIYIELIGVRYKTNFDKFLGKQEEFFENGFWNSETWAQKIQDRTKPKVEKNGAMADAIARSTSRLSKYQ
jgi:hypothetical protein